MGRGLLSHGVVGGLLRVLRVCLFAWSPQSPMIFNLLCPDDAAGRKPDGVL